jgi:glycosyltransferase involved in cell wall biosynthesis
MKILTGIDLPYSPSCGSTILCDELYASLAPRHRTRFLSLASPGEIVRTRLSDLQLLPVKKITDTAHYGAYVAALGVHVRRHVDEFRPDVLHAQHLSYGMALALCEVPDLPLVAVCHGTDVLSALTSDFHRRCVQAVLDRASRVVFPSMGMLADTERVARVDREKVQIVPWGLPATYFEGKLASFSGGPIKLIFAGRFQEGKGLETLLRGFARLEGDFTLTIAGDGPSRNDVVALVHQLGIEARVMFRGWLARETLRDELRQHHVLVAPSRGIEAFCLVAAEAQACALPVVHARVGGLPEIANSPDLCFEPDDVDAMIGCIYRAAASQDAWRLYSQRSLSNAWRYRLELTARGFETLSLQAIEAARRGTGDGATEAVL